MTEIIIYGAKIIVDLENYERKGDSGVLMEFYESLQFVHYKWLRNIIPNDSICLFFSHFCLLPSNLLLTSQEILEKWDAGKELTIEEIAHKILPKLDVIKIYKDPEVYNKNIDLIIEELKQNFSSKYDNHVINKWIRFLESAKKLVK